MKNYKTDKQHRYFLIYYIPLNHSIQAESFLHAGAWASVRLITGDIHSASAAGTYNYGDPMGHCSRSQWAIPSRQNPSYMQGHQIWPGWSLATATVHLQQVLITHRDPMHWTWHVPLSHSIWAKSFLNTGSEFWAGWLLWLLAASTVRLQQVLIPHGDPMGHNGRSLWGLLSGQNPPCMEGASFGRVDHWPHPQCVRGRCLCLLHERKEKKHTWPPILIFHTWICHATCAKSKQQAQGATCMYFGIVLGFPYLEYHYARSQGTKLYKNQESSFS